MVDATDRELRISHEVAAVAQSLNTTNDAVALAWLLRHPAMILPVVGTATPQRLRDNAIADAIDLTKQQWWQLYVASRGGTIP